MVMNIALFTDTNVPQIHGVSLTLHRLVQYLNTQGIKIRVFAPETNKGDFFAEHLHSFASIPFFSVPGVPDHLVQLYTLEYHSVGRSASGKSMTANPS